MTRRAPAARLGDEHMMLPKYGRGRSQADVRAEESGRIRDRRYLDTAPGRICAVPGCGKTAACGCHIRFDLAGGTGLKPSDDEIDWLCAEHHDDQERNPGAEWWIRMVFLPLRRAAYRAWKEGR